ncbi:hypothetical protein ABZ953_06620 [Streptomyces sp. NPDC046465]|uniref:hypothetical protein n=1 Tax=Streptomyces sp. NPDC046465 TaxID=3155810 RepID=UPI0033EE4E8E
MTTSTTSAPTVIAPDHRAAQLHNIGATYGALQPGKPTLREMVLPDGWTVTQRGESVWVHDQHGRRRLDIGPDVFTGRLDVHFIEAGSHARHVAEYGATLVLDEWATPGALLAVVGERIETYVRLIYVNESGVIRWAVEQPRHADTLRAQLEGYRRKLTAYRDVLQTLTEAITSGWTPGWTDQQTHVHHADPARPALSSLTRPEGAPDAQQL